MNHRVLLVLPMLLFLIAPHTLAQSQPGAGSANEFRRFEIFWAPYSYSRQGEVNLHGGEFDFAVNATDRLALVADLSGHFQGAERTFLGLQIAGDMEVWAYRFGPRFTLHKTDRATVFAHGLAGGTRLVLSRRFSNGNTTIVESSHIDGFSMAIGGGIDVAWKRWLAVRAVQADYSLLHYSDLGTSNGLRIGGGLVFRFGE